RRVLFRSCDHGLHPAALPHPVALLSVAAAGAVDRRPAAQRPGGGRGAAPGAGIAAVPLAVLDRAAGRHGPVGAAVPRLRRPAAGAEAALMRERRQRIRNASAEAAQFRLRALVGFGLVLLGLLGLAGWYFRL